MTSQRARWVAICLSTSILVGCGLPRSGPTKAEIFSSSVQKQGDAYIVTVDDAVAKAASFQPALGFSSALIHAGVVGSDTIRPGDTLGLSIWENVDDGLLTQGGTAAVLTEIHAGVVGSDTIRPGDTLGLSIWENVDDGLLTQGGGTAAVLTEIQVDGDGFIFVPYAGRIKASGNTPETIRRIITEKLEAQTPDPQVMVQRMAGDGATVSLIGGVGAQGVYPIERPNRTLTAMLATAGGITLPPEITQITLIRGGHSGTIWLTDLYENPRLDIALRAGDRILVEEDERFYTALGATGAQVKVPFETQAVSAIEALATVGGLSPALADPTGIFVFRDEPEHIAKRVLGRSDLQGEQRVVYVLDLTKPNGVFLARDFDIRDHDTVYVTEAPYNQFTKVLNAIVAPASTAASLDSLTE